MLYHVVIEDDFTHKGCIEEHTAGSVANVEPRIAVTVECDNEGYEVNKNANRNQR